MLQEHCVGFHNIHVVKGLLPPNLVKPRRISLIQLLVNFNDIPVQYILILLVLSPHQNFQVVLADLPICVVLDHVFDEANLLILWL